MNPTSTEPTNEPTVPETNSVPTEPVTPVVPVEPMTPTSPAAPIGSPETLVPTPEPKKSQKKLFTILGIVGGVILLSVIGVLLYTTLSGASPEDYKKATTQYNTTSSANSSLARNVSSLNSGLRSDTDEEFNAALKDAETSLGKLKEENTKLGDLKAVKVGEGKDLYKTFNDKMTGYTAYAGDIIQSAKKARPGIIACEKARDTTTSAERIAGLKDCSTALVAVGDLPSAAFDAYVKSLTTIYADYAVTYEKVSALTNPLGAQYEEYKVLRDKLSASTKSLTTAAKDYQTAVKAKDDEVSVKDSAQALGKFLSEQQTK